MKHFYFFLVVFILVTVFSSANVQAADPMGRFGWMTLVSDIIGDDVTCGAGFVKHELVIRSVDTGNLVTPNFAIFRSEDRISGSVYDSASGSGSTIGPICFNPDTQYLKIAIDGGASFYNFMSLNQWKTPATVPRGKFMRTTVWIASTGTGTAEYKHFSPVNAITNINPPYKIALNDFPTTYGATGMSEANLFVTEYDPMTNTIGNTVVKETIPLSGGAAIKTLPAQSLADGIYTWAYYLKLNGSHNAGGGFNVTQVLMSGFSSFDWPFMLDSTPPDFGTGVNHTPANPYDTDPVTITANVTDSLSGINQITVYLDGNPVPVKTCSFFASSSASCIFVGGPYLAGSNHTYFAKATDIAGNVATSATMNFTVLSATPTLTLSASRNPIASGDSSTLTWSTAGTASCWASNGWTGWKSNTGSSQPVAPTVTTTYTLECWNLAGVSTGQKSVTLRVNIFKVCKDSCDSSILRGLQDTNKNFTLAENANENLVACFNEASGCTDASGDVTSGTIWNEDLGNSTVSLSDVAGAKRVTATVSGNEIIGAIYSGQAASMDVSVVCVETATCAAEQIKVCSQDTVTGGRTVVGHCTPIINCDGEPGTRYCDYNWKETAP